MYVKIGEGGEPDIPSDTTVVQIVQNIDGTQWVWNPTTQTWIEVNPSLPSGIYTPDTVDDLRLIDDNGLLRMAFTAGTVTRFDGQARSYKWNPNDDRPDDGIQVVRPASQAAGAYGAWNEL